jgi:flagellar basal body-associated protein FliL
LAFIIRIYHDARSSKSKIIIIIIIIIIITAIELSLGGSSPYTSTDKTNKNKIYINETIQKHSTTNTKHSKYKYTYYQNTHTLRRTQKGGCASLAKTCNYF